MRPCMLQHMHGKTMRHACARMHCVRVCMCTAMHRQHCTRVRVGPRLRDSYTRINQLCPSAHEQAFTVVAPPEATEAPGWGFGGAKAGAGTTRTASKSGGGGPITRITLTKC